MIHTVVLGDFPAALDVARSECISLVGGGGKTTLLFALGDQLPGTVVLSTTTKMGTDRTHGFVPLIDPSDAELASALTHDRVVLTWKDSHDHRALGYRVDEVDRFVALADVVVLEADGSRRRPFKAPAAHEPVIAAATTMLVACVGAPAFGGVIAEVCHRPDAVAALADCAVDDVLTAERLANLLMSEQGSRKNCPPAARFSIALNQVTPTDDAFVATLGELIGDRAEIFAITQDDR